MLSALDENGRLVSLLDGIPANQNFVCPACRSAVRLKNGKVMRPHFAHVSLDKCDFYSENESSEHLQLKAALYHAVSRTEQVVVEKVLPELENGNMVIMDRFIDSSVAYQGAGRGLDQDEVAWLNNYATDGHKPDLTLLFDVDSETGLARIAANGEREVNRLDLEKLDMHQRVRQGYLDLAEAEPERIKRIDASQTLEEVVEDTWEIIKSYL